MAGANHEWDEGGRCKYCGYLSRSREGLRPCGFAYLRASKVDTFHDHLDICAECREHPFALCSEGHRLLTGTVDAVGQPTNDPI